MAAARVAASNQEAVLQMRQPPTPPKPMLKTDRRFDVSEMQQARAHREDVPFEGPFIQHRRRKVPDGGGGAWATMEGARRRTGPT